MLPFVSLFQSWIWNIFVLQDLKRVLSFPPYTGDYLHPVVYACTAVMLLCLLVSIMTYIIHHRWAKQIVRTFVENLIQYSHFSADTKKRHVKVLINLPWMAWEFAHFCIVYFCCCCKYALKDTEVKGGWGFESQLNGKEFPQLDSKID